MATTYKTPGVYVEEIPKFPPSVAPVDTAIPAFIGYTEKAIDEVADDLLLKPKRIESLVEFEQYFGAPQPETEIVVTITDRAGTAPPAWSPPRSTRRDRSKHILYYALQLFYANGGGSRATSSRSATYKAIGDAARRSTELQAAPRRR